MTMIVRKAVITRMTTVMSSYPNIPRRFASRARPTAKKPSNPPSPSHNSKMPIPDMPATSATLPSASQSVPATLFDLPSTDYPQDKRPAMFRKGYWTAEKRQHMKVMTIAFPFMIASAAILYQKYISGGDQTLLSDEEKLTRAFEQANKASTPHSSTSSTLTTTKSS